MRAEARANDFAPDQGAAPKMRYSLRNTPILGNAFHKAFVTIVLRFS
jgi:hypothetical protein